MRANEVELAVEPKQNLTWTMDYETRGPRSNLGNMDRYNRPGLNTSVARVVNNKVRPTVSVAGGCILNRAEATWNTRSCTYSAYSLPLSDGRAPLAEAKCSALRPGQRAFAGVSCRTSDAMHPEPPRTLSRDLHPKDEVPYRYQTTTKFHEDLRIAPLLHVTPLVGTPSMEQVRPSRDRNSTREGCELPPPTTCCWSSAEPGCGPAPAPEGPRLQSPV